MQAIRARLSGLIPYRGERRWSQRATGYLEEYAIYVNAFLDGTGGFVAQVQGWGLVVDVLIDFHIRIKEIVNVVFSGKPRRLRNAF